MPALSSVLGAALRRASLRAVILCRFYGTVHWQAKRAQNFSEVV
jgi:hypothetical protein